MFFYLIFPKLSSFWSKPYKNKQNFKFLFNVFLALKKTKNTFPLSQASYTFLKQIV